MSSRQIPRLGWIITFVTIAACTNSKLNRLPVRGRVNYDGAPAKRGMITFRPASKSKGPATGTAIIDGEFAIAADKGPTPGPHDVEVKIANVTSDPPKSDQPALASKGNIQFKSFSEHVDISHEKTEFNFSYSSAPPPGRH